MPGSLRLFACLITLALSSLTAQADEKNAPAGDFDALIRRLDANEFADRQAASDELSRLGSQAFPALERAARSESREASQRAIEILKRHYEGADTPTRQAARSTLERLAADSSTRSGRQADEVLNPPPPPATARVVFGRPPVRVARANIRIQAPPARFVRRVHVKNVNGVKEVEVEENGRKVKVVDNPNEGIQLEVTEKKNGKETTEKFSAKDADELKKKHPEAHKIYEELGKQNGGIQIQVGGAIAPRRAVQPEAPGEPKPAEEAPTKEMQLKAAQQSVEAIDRHIETLQRAFPDRPDVQRHVERLREHRKQIEKRQSDLQKDAG